tara:strand:+ start:272 stop:835 length:564 start_codon:yes stop_codon:yes gene_type:complete
MSAKLEIEKLGAYIVKLAQINLGASQTIDGKKRVTNSTGDLSKSLDYRVVQKRNEKGQYVSGFDIQITSSEDYASFIEQGVKGSESTKPSAKNSPFQFKSKNLPKGVMARWIKNKGIKPQKKGGGFVEKTESTMKGLAYVLGRAVATKGISARNYVKDATEQALRNSAGKVAREIYIDYIKKELKSK